MKKKMTSEETTTVKVPKFDGDEKNYQTWLIWFEAFAQVKGFIVVLEDGGITIKEDNVETLELKPKYRSGVTGARDATEEKSSGLVKETRWHWLI